MERPVNKPYVLLIYVVLAVATFIAFEPARLNGFVNYDDDDYVTRNPQVSAGLTPESVRWAFTTPYMANWHPLTWLSHMLDCELFGLNPLRHHLTSLSFHIANTLLLFWVLKRMTGVVWQSAFVAAVFALHPLRVESVAWVAERKDVLSGFFWMLTMALYVRYAERVSIGRYIAVFLSFGLGLMAKPMLVTLPFVLLLLDYWPLGRFQLSRDAGYRSLFHLVREKVPLFVLSIASSVVTFIVQQGAGAMKPAESFGLNIRISNAIVSYMGYIFKMIYPIGLAPLYPHPGGNLPRWQPIVFFVILAVTSAGIIYMHRRYLIAGWLWYLGMLVPVIGLVQVGQQAMADRYSYLPSIGIFIMVGWGANELLERWRYRKIGLGISAAVVLAALLICTRIQVRYWQNNLTLFRHTIEVTSNNFVMHSNYGNALLEEGVLEQAIENYNEALRVKPNYAAAVNNLAWILATTEDVRFSNPADAVKLARKACVLTNYKDAESLDTLAAAYAAAGRFKEAIETAEKAIEVAVSAGRKDLAAEIQGRLELYRAGKPYIEKPPAQDNVSP